jgi:hypothetical protein
MYNIIANQTSEHLLIFSVAIIVVGVTFSLITNYNNFYNYNLAELNNVVRERIVDPTRVHEGLPTDVTLTPQDFIDNPELAEIFDVPNTNNNLELVLESNEHFEAVQNLAVDYENFRTLLDVIRDFFSSFLASPFLTLLDTIIEFITSFV